MFFKNILKTHKIKKSWHHFGAFESGITGAEKHHSETALCYNFLVENGALKTGVGFSRIQAPISEESIYDRYVLASSVPKGDLWHFKCFDPQKNARCDKVFWSTDDGNLEVMEVMAYSQTAVTLDTNFSAPPAGIGYTDASGQDMFLFSTQGALMKFADGTVASVLAELPQFMDICYAYDRLWGVVAGKRNRVLYSNKLDPTLWTSEENFLLFDDEIGAVNKLVLFEGDLYAFREHGITKISEYGTAREFVVSSVFVTKSTIYGKTVVVCGDKILFLTRDGLYSFNGNGVQPVLPRLKRFLQKNVNKFAVACFDGRFYVLACKLNFADDEIVGCEGFVDGFHNNALVLFDIDANQASLMRGMDVRSLVAVVLGKFCKVFASFYGQYANKIGVMDFSGAMFETPLPKLWKSHNNFLGATEVRNLRKIVVDTPTDCILTVYADAEKQSFVVVGDDLVQDVCMFTKGRKIAVEFSTTGDALIYPPKILFEEIVDKY